MTCKTICDCRNESEYTACTEDVPCGSDYCQSSPCAYAILSPCDMGGTWTTDDTNDPTRLLRPRLRWITMLWRDCLFSSTWTARYGSIDPNDLIGPVDACLDESGVPMPDVCNNLSFPNSGIGPALVPRDWLPTGKVDDDCDYPCVKPLLPLCNGDHLSPMHFGCGPMQTWFYGGGSSDHCGWGDQYDSSSANTHCNIKEEKQVWELSITGITSAGPNTIGARITAYTDQFSSAVAKPILNWDCNDFQCLGRSTFTFAGYNLPTVNGQVLTTDHDVYKGYPDKFCVTAYSSRYIHKCTTAADACACEDAGWSTILVPNNITCDNTGSDYLTLTRTYDTTLIVDGIDITAEACGIPTGPCGYFYGGADTTCGTPGTDPNRFLIYFLWCDGSQWKYRVCCVKLTSNVSGESTGIESVDVVCDGNYTKPEACVMTNVWDAIPCDTSSSGCCAACDGLIDNDCCPDDPIPSTLYATLAAASCSQLDGVVVTLTYVGSGEWSGDFVATAAPLRCGTLTFSFVLTPDCNIYMYIKDAGGSVVWGSTTTPCNTLICPMVSEACTNPVPPCQASILPPLCSGNMTATVTP